MPAESKTNHLVIRVDGIDHTITVPTSSGAQLKALAQKDAIYQLFQEGEGEEPDHLVPDHETIVLRDGQAFYTIPPAMAGR